MGHYTKLDDPRIDSMVDTHARAIVEAIISRCASVRSVYLTGGFGRGEGTVRFVQNGWRPCNDYDILVVERVPTLTTHDCAGLGRQLASQLGVDAVDIGSTTVDELSAQTVSMDNYDFQNGARLLYGTDVRYVMTRFPEGALPYFDFVRLLCNRAAGLLTADWPERYGDSEYRHTQVVKASIAVGDAAVALRSSYHHSYEERLTRFRALKRENMLPVWLGDSATDLIDRAFSVKLGRDHTRLSTPPQKLLSSMLGHAYCDLVERASAQRCASVGDAEAVALRAFGAIHVSRIFNRGSRRILIRRNIKDLRRYILLTQVPMYVAHLRGGSAVCAAYLRRYWWVDAALRRPLNGAGAARLWDQLVH